MSQGSNISKSFSGSLVNISQLSAGYNGETILEDINLTIEREDFIGLIGPNGGGENDPAEGHSRPAESQKGLHPGHG